MSLKVPKSRVAKVLHPHLAKRIAAGGRKAKVAKAIAKRLHPHAEEELAAVPHEGGAAVSAGIAIPQPMKIEHDELHNELKQAIAVGGKVGEAATAVAMALHPHFGSEEEYALPPLGLLPALAQGQVTAEMAKVLPLTDKLKVELPHMLQEHQAIVATLKNLREAATVENKPEVVHFADKLMLHAQTEEQVWYPTTILIGEYVKLALKK